MVGMRTPPLLGQRAPAERFVGQPMCVIELPARLRMSSDRAWFCPRPSAGLVEEGLNPGRIAGSPEIDHGDRRFVVQRNRIGIDPVANLVTVEHGEDRIKLGRWAP